MILCYKLNETQVQEMIGRIRADLEKNEIPVCNRVCLIFKSYEIGPCVPDSGRYHVRR